MIFRNSRGWICSFPGSFSWYSVKKDFDFWIVASRWGSKERSGPFFSRQIGRSFCNFEVPIYFYYFTYGPLKSFGCSKPDAGTYPVRDWANHGDEKDFVFGNYEKSDCPMDAWEARLNRQKSMQFVTSKSQFEGFVSSYQHPPNGPRLNPKRLLKGALSHPFGTPWKVQVQSSELRDDLVQ